MFSRKNTRNFTKGVRIDLDGNKVTVDITIVVDYGSPVPDVARSIQENVKKAIETMSGLDVRSVDVHVSGISFEREQLYNAELVEQQRKMLEKTEESVEEAVKEAKAEAEEAVAEEADPEDDLDLEIDDDPDDEEPLDDEPAEEDPVADEAEDEPEEEPEETEEEKPEAAE